MIATAAARPRVLFGFILAPQLWLSPPSTGFAPEGSFFDTEGSAKNKKDLLVLSSTLALGLSPKAG